MILDIITEYYTDHHTVHSQYSTLKTESTVPLNILVQLMLAYMIMIK